MSLMIFNRFGGRRYRYKSIPGTLVEMLDPWERRTISLSSPWLRDLWLCCRADPAVEAVVERPKPLEYLDRGQRHRGVADFAIKKAGSLTYHALLKEGSERSLQRERQLSLGARAHRVHQRVWSHEELSQCAPLIENMGYARHCLAVWLDSDLAAVEMVITDALANGTYSRGQLKQSIRAKFGEEGLLQSDAAIFRLYFTKHLTLDLNRRYDDESQIDRL